jgi:hypothetical protein
MLKKLATKLVSRFTPKLYDEILQENHEDYRQKEIGAEKGSLAFNVLKNRKLYDEVTDSGAGKIRKSTKK